MLKKRQRNQNLKNKFIRMFWAYEGDAATGDTGGGAAGASAEAVPTDPGYAETTIPMTVPPVEKTVTVNLSDYISEELRKEPYFENILKTEKPIESLVKEYANGQKLIGQRGIPEPNAPQEKWDEFYAKLRPEAPDKYEFTDPDYTDDEKKLAEVINKTVTPEYTADVKALFHQLGLSAKQADGLQKGFAKLQMKHQGPELNRILDETQKADKDFDVLAVERFGADKDKVLALGKSLLDENVSAEDKQLFADIPAKYLVPFAAALKNIAAKYIKEDRIDPSSGTQNNVRTEAEVRAEGQRLYAEIAQARREGKPIDLLKEKVKQNYAQLGAR